ncbi:MAG: TQO small subunit DoxD, partial [Solirubrobacteraceae bacterium]
MNSRADQRSLEADARRLGWALFPVRLFLGITFIYGGIQKLSDPGFLHAGAPTYIGTQLRGFANGTPGGFLLRAFAIPHPALAGVGVALLEIAVGLLVTAGLLTRAAATVGLLLNLLLFLTNSWHTYPYFLCSDIVFVVAWLPLALVGATRQPTLESIVH